MSDKQSITANTADQVILFTRIAILLVFDWQLSHLVSSFAILLRFLSYVVIPQKRLIKSYFFAEFYNVKKLNRKGIFSNRKYDLI